MVSPANRLVPPTLLLPADTTHPNARPLAAMPGGMGCLAWRAAGSRC